MVLGGHTAARVSHALARGAAALRGEVWGAPSAGQLKHCLRGSQRPLSPSSSPSPSNPLSSSFTTDTARAAAQPPLHTAWRHLTQGPGKTFGAPLAGAGRTPTPGSGSAREFSLKGLVRIPPAKSATHAPPNSPGQGAGGAVLTEANQCLRIPASQAPTGSWASTGSRAPRGSPGSSESLAFAGVAGALRGGQSGVNLLARSGSSLGTGSVSGASRRLQGAWGRQQRALSSAAYSRQWAYGAPGGDSALMGLMIVNGLVFVAWQTLDQRFMSRHFLVSSEALRRGRWYTVVTSIFSHKDMGHLLPNLVTLYFFGKEVGMYFGGPYLIGLYLAGGVVGSLAHVAFYSTASPRRKGQGFQLIRGYSPPALGASGAVNAIVLFNCLLEPFRIVYLNMFIPLPSIALGLLFIAQDLYGAASGTSRVGHAAHLGGAAVGVLAFLQYRFGRGRFRF